jgi:hypothetical protein
VYLAELAPAQLRGKFVGASIFFGGFGVLLAQLVGGGAARRGPAGRRGAHTTRAAAPTRLPAGSSR